MASALRMVYFPVDPAISSPLDGDMIRVCLRKIQTQAHVARAQIPHTMPVLRMALEMLFGIKIVFSSIH